MRKITDVDVTMFDNLMTLLNRRAIFRKVSADEASAIHQARMWGKKFREELDSEVKTTAALAGAKCVDPGPAAVVEPPVPAPSKGKKK